MAPTAKRGGFANDPDHKYNANDVVLAKIKGFPAWPGIVMDDANVPSAVREERPASKSAALYTIRFFPAADYHWAPARDLNPLSSEDIEAFLGSTQKKSGELVKAYKIARDPRVWNEQMNKVVKEAEEEEESDRKRKPRSGPARKSEPKKQRVESEAKLDEAPATREETEDEMDPQTRKVREWRHKLQRAFLNKDGVIVAEDMKNQDETFKIVEAYTEMTPEQLRATKIGKVMRRIHQLGEVPRDDEFHFKSRAGELMNRWSAILGAH